MALDLGVVDSGEVVGAADQNLMGPAVVDILAGHVTLMAEDTHLRLLGRSPIFLLLYWSLG